ncbi:MAG: glycosyltransferase family 2 protein [Planctomycetia bacterium]|nr:glycosyltransferase family 2 protein [Planctomycetia bacterium]
MRSRRRRRSADRAAGAKTVLSRAADAELDAFLASGRSLDIPAVAEPDVSVLLILWNQAALTLRCLRSLAREAKRGVAVEIVIIDNGSTDLTHELTARLGGVTTLRNEVNGGFLAACNQAAALARGRCLLLLNNDTAVREGALAAAVACLDSAADIGAVGGRLVLPDGMLQEAGGIVWADGTTSGYGRGKRPDAAAFMHRRDVDYCSAAFLLTRRHAWEQLGGFAELFAPAYYEDADYCLRLWAAGWRVVYEPAVVVDHYEYASDRSGAAGQLIGRNRGLFVTRHADTLAAHHIAPDRRRRSAASVHWSRRSEAAVAQPKSRRERSGKAATTRAVACMLVHGDAAYARAARVAVDSLLADSDFDVLVVHGGGPVDAWPRQRRLHRQRIECPPADGHRARRFLLKFEALQTCLERFDAPWVLNLDADVVLARPLRGVDVAAALDGAGLGMVEQTCIRGSTMDRRAFLDHYRTHSLAAIAPDAPVPAVDAFRYYNSGVVVAAAATLSALVAWALQAIAGHAGEYQSGEHIVADQDFFQYWANQLHPESSRQLPWYWNHCEHWDADFPRRGVLFAHFSNFCLGPSGSTVRRMRRLRRPWTRWLNRCMSPSSS